MLLKYRTANSTYKKLAVQCSADTFVVNQNWFSASTFVVKISTFAKPETVISKPKGRPCNHQTKTETTKLSGDNNSVDNFAVTPYRPDLFAALVSKTFSQCYFYPEK